LALTPDDKQTWYAGGATRYADYRLLPMIASFAVFCGGSQGIAHPFVTWNDKWSRCIAA